VKRASVIRIAAALIPLGWFALGCDDEGTAPGCVTRIRDGAGNYLTGLSHIQVGATLSVMVESDCGVSAPIWSSSEPTLASVAKTGGVDSPTATVAGHAPTTGSVVVGIAVQSDGRAGTAYFTVGRGLPPR